MTEPSLIKRLLKSLRDDASYHSPKEREKHIEAVKEDLHEAGFDQMPWCDKCCSWHFVESGMCDSQGAK